MTTKTTKALTITGERAAADTDQRRKLPSISVLEKWQAEGLTRQEMRERLAEQGTIVSASAIAVALHRAGRSPNRDRYDDVLPWVVSTPHVMMYQARMLRLLGRQRHGHDLTPDQAATLERWLKKLKLDNMVVGYQRYSAQGGPGVGFLYVDSRPGVDELDGLPIRHELIAPEELA